MPNPALTLNPEDGSLTGLMDSSATQYHVKYRGEFVCRRCSGTGQFVTMTLNGKPAGPGGMCFRCEGKGFLAPKDDRRNLIYDMHAVSRAVDL